MANREHLKPRLEQELIERLSAVAETKKITVNDAIFFALDALDREENDRAFLSERVEKLEATIGNLVDAMAAFSASISDRFNEASAIEKTRLESVTKFLKDHMLEHDNLEKNRHEVLLQAANKRGPF